MPTPERRSAAQASADCKQRPPCQIGICRPSARTLPHVPVSVSIVALLTMVVGFVIFHRSPPGPDSQLASCNSARARRVKILLMLCTQISVKTDDGSYISAPA